MPKAGPSRGSFEQTGHRFPSILVMGWVGTCSRFFVQMGKYLPEEIDSGIKVCSSKNNGSNTEHFALPQPH